MDQLKIILQEPDADVRAVLQIIFEDYHYLVSAQPGYDRLTEAIESFCPDIVLLDFRMSGRDAIETCVKIKLIYPHLPVIALSCNSRIKELFAINGFDGYLAKPFDIEQLVQILNDHIHTVRDEALINPSMR